MPANQEGLSMAFFRKKEAEAPKKTRAQDKAERSLSEIVHERVLTAEGWRRKLLAKAETPSKKASSNKA